MLLQLLASENELIVGNAAFCLSQCLDVPGAATSLLNSNIVLVLLKLAGGDARKTAVQENATVALGKLCTAEPRYFGLLVTPGALPACAAWYQTESLWHQSS